MTLLHKMKYMYINNLTGAALRQCRISEVCAKSRAVLLLCKEIVVKILIITVLLRTQLSLRYDLQNL